MPTSYSIPDVYEDEIEAVVEAGYYSSKSDVVRDAIRLLFETKNNLKLSAAIEMYKNGKVTLSKAAELAGLDTISFKETLKDRGIKIDVQVDDKGTLEKRSKPLDEWCGRMEKTPVLVDTNILSTFAKIDRLKLLFEIMDREKLYISTSVLQGLDNAKRVWYDFVRLIFEFINNEKISVLSLNEEETELYLSLPDSFGDGERESIAISKCRGYIFSSNENRVKNYCDKNDIKIVDLPTLLRRAWNTGLKEKEKVRDIVEAIEKQDSIIFKDKSIIFEE